MCTHIEGRDSGAVDAEYGSQICFDYHAINGMPGLSRELMDFVRAERTMGRIAFERLPCSSNRCLLRWVEPVKISPEFLDCPVLITHAPGGVSLSAVSIETKRPFSKSSRASMKSCGISSDPKLAHLLDETLTLGLRQGFDFFDDLFCGHLIRIPTKLTIYLQKEQCPRLPRIVSRLRCMSDSL